mgnify:FL=1
MISKSSELSYGNIQKMVLIRDQCTIIIFLRTKEELSLRKAAQKVVCLVNGVFTTVKSMECTGSNESRKMSG